MSTTPVVAGAMLHRHTAYGLSIDSTFPLPELDRRRVDDASPVDVVVRDGLVPDVPADAVAFGDVGQRWFGDAAWIDVAGACRLWIRAGREIVIEPVAPADDRLRRLFVEGVGLGVVLQQRGMFSLHASAAQIGAVAVAFVGAARAGKSTMAAELRRRGHRIVADDLVAIDLSDPRRPLASTGFPQLKLTPGSAAAVGQALDGLTRLGDDHPKFGCPVDHMANGQMPLARVYVLTEGDTLAIEPLPPQEALVELIRHTYASMLLTASGKQAAHLRQCAALIGAVRVCRLRRPFALSALADVGALVERDCEESPS